MNLPSWLSRFFGGGSRNVSVAGNAYAPITTGDNSPVTVIAPNGPITLDFPERATPSDSIEGLLKWSYRIPPTLYGREAELGTLLRWAEDQGSAGEVRPLRIRILYGEGGSGKTRLAFELAEQLRQKEWEAGGYRLRSQEQEGPLAFHFGKNGTLVIIDYPEQNPAALEALLRQLDTASATGKNLRLLLLCRNADQTNALVRQCAAGRSDPPMHLNPLPPDGDAAWLLFTHGWRAMAAVKHRTGEPPPADRATFTRWLTLDSSHARPLLILAYALNLFDDAQATALRGGEIIQALVEREIRRIRDELRPPPAQPEQTDRITGVLLLHALSSITGPLDKNTLSDLCSRLEPVLQQVPHAGITLPPLTYLQEKSLWCNGSLNALEPDLFAAEYIHQIIEQYLPDKLTGPVLALALLHEDKTEARERLTRLGRLCWDWQVLHRHAGRNPLVLKLVHYVETDDELAQFFDRQVNQDNQALEVPLMPLALACARRVAALDEERAKADTSVLPELARRLNNLSIRLAANGERPAALAAIRRAVEIHEQLARDNFAAYAPVLAGSLGNLSIRLAEHGERPAALAAIRRAVEIHEQLARNNFSAYAPVLAMSLNTLSNRLAEHGERPAALAASQRAVEIYEQLARDNFAAYAPVLAGSLGNLSIRLAEHGERPAALAAIRRAVEIDEQLARDNFAAYAPDLALSLNNWSVDLAENGERPAALAAIRRAVEIREQLARDNFAAHAPDLAGSLGNLSIRLAEHGERPAALAASRRAVVIDEQLARDNFAAYAPVLAGSLGNLSIRLAEHGERPAALAAIRRAVDIREQLARDNFAAYAPVLALSLNNWSLCLAENGERPAALAAIRRAVEIHEQLARDNFAAYAPDLAQSLNNWSVRLAENGERPAALAAIQRAVEIREQLAQDNLAAYAGDLARSLYNLALRLYEDAQTRTQALPILERVLVLLEPIALPNTSYGDWLAYAQSLHAQWLAEVTGSSHSQ